MKQVSVQVSQNKLELPISAAELEEILRGIGAEITHPVHSDPVATLEGKVVAFWLE